MTGEREKMAAMNRWLDEVCTELGVDRELMTQTTGPLLALIRDVAHGPSRPAAPLTAFLLGLASARDGAGSVEDQAAAVGARIETLSRLAREWPASSAPA